MLDAYGDWGGSTKRGGVATSDVAAFHEIYKKELELTDSALQRRLLQSRNCVAWRHRRAWLAHGSAFGGYD